jgi:hypothetical protein
MGYHVWEEVPDLEALNSGSSLRDKGKIAASDGWMVGWLDGWMVGSMEADVDAGADVDLYHFTALCL